MCTDFRRGSISVFLAAAMAAVMVFCCVVLESARSAGVKRAIQSAGNAAADSVAAGYDRMLAEEYGLLFYDGGMGHGLTDFDGIEDEFGVYFAENASVRSISSGSSLFPVADAEVRMTAMTAATDYNGEIFIRSALDFYKFDAAAGLLSALQDQLDLIGKGEQAKAESDLESSGLHDPDGLKKPPENIQLMQSSAECGQRFGTAVQLSAGGRAAPITAAEEGGDESFDTEHYENEIKNSPIGSVEEVKKKGILSLVLPERAVLSGITLEADDLPSVCARDGRRLNGGSVLAEIGEKLAFNEYLLDFFGCYTEESDSGMHYELEYLLCGREADSDNLKAVLNRLMLIREGMNLSYLMSSSEKRAAVEAAASVMVDWTGIPAIGKIVGAALLASWAYAESVLDVRTLLAGGEVPLAKDDGSWTLSLSGVNSFLNGGDCGTGHAADGLSYKAYLRLLMFLTDAHTLAYRAMDMIQVNMQDRGRDFLMESQLYAMEFRVRAAAKQLFTGLPFVMNRFARIPRSYREEQYFTSIY